MTDRLKTTPQLISLTIFIQVSVISIVGDWIQYWIVAQLRSPNFIIFGRIYINTILQGLTETKAFLNA